MFWAELAAGAAEGAGSGICPGGTAVPYGKPMLAVDAAVGL